MEVLALPDSRAPSSCKLATGLRSFFAFDWPRRQAVEASCNAEKTVPATCGGVSCPGRSSFRRVDQLAVGDWVAVLDPATGKHTFDPLVVFTKRQPGAVPASYLRLALEGGVTLTVTGEHAGAPPPSGSRPPFISYSSLSLIMSLFNLFFGALTHSLVIIMMCSFRSRSVGGARGRCCPGAAGPGEGSGDRVGAGRRGLHVYPAAP